MDHDQASDIIRQLSDGFDPDTGREFPADSPFQHPQIVRALYVARRALDRAATAANRARSRPRAEHAGLPWTREEDDALGKAHDEGISIKDLAVRHKRSLGAIKARLAGLGKIAPGESRFRV